MAVCLAVVLCWNIPSLSQVPGVDTSYIQTFDDRLTGRFYFSQKYTSIRIKTSRQMQDLRFRPNTTVNMGLGATYRSLTLNLAYGFPFMNRDREKGTTRYLDLQSHIYTRNWSMDFFGQLYKGYYLHPRGLATPDPEKFYVRPDMGVSLFGIAVYHIQNGKRFSYRAAMVQNEWQKKSAGTWLLGGEIHAGSFSGDSSFIPTSLSEANEQPSIRKVRFLEAGPGAGFAYTLVIGKHWFLTLSSTLALDISLSKEYNDGNSHDKFSVSPNFMYRGVAGYNSNSWNVSFSTVGMQVAVKGAASRHQYLFSTGNYRLTIAKRFLPGQRLKKQLKWLEPK